MFLLCYLKDSTVPFSIRQWKTSGAFVPIFNINPSLSNLFEYILCYRIYPFEFLILLFIFTTTGFIFSLIFIIDFAVPFLRFRILHSLPPQVWPHRSFSLQALPPHIIYWLLKPFPKGSWRLPQIMVFHLMPRFTSSEFICGNTLQIQQVSYPLFVSILIPMNVPAASGVVAGRTSIRYGKRKHCSPRLSISLCSFAKSLSLIFLPSTTYYMIAALSMQPIR